ncbi:MAG: OmpH family outer membrane protein [Simkaniaceae bacterium]
MNKKHLLSLGLSALFATSALMANEEKKVALVNFTTCILESKYGMDEQESFENIKKQMASLVEDSEKNLRELAAKFNDSDYMDGLSPEAEGELKGKYQSLSEEYSRYQNQFMQVMNQAQMKMYQSMQVHINDASEKVAREHHLSLILNKDVAFYFDNALDMTDLVIKELNQEYEKKGKNNIALQAPSEVLEKKGK